MINIRENEILMFFGEIFFLCCCDCRSVILLLSLLPNLISLETDLTLLQIYVHTYRMTYIIAYKAYTQICYNNNNNFAIIIII